MMIYLDLPKNLTTFIEQQAQHQGVSVETFISQTLIQHFKFNESTPIERPFNFEIDELQHSIESGFVEVPSSALHDFEHFENWLNGKTT